MRALLTGAPREVRRVNDSVARFLWERQIAPDRLHDVQLVLEELVTNVIRHGGRDAVRPRIAVEADIVGDAVRLSVEDDCRPFDPTAVPEPPLPATIEDRRSGGHGLRIVRRLVSRLTYTRLPQGNRTEALIPLDRAPGLER